MADRTKRAFFSYSQSNRELAELVIPVIESAGFEVWSDEKTVDSGKDLADALRDAISASDLVIMLVTPGAIRSSRLPFEVGMARALDTPVLALYDGLSPTELPTYVMSLQTAGVSQVAEALGNIVSELNVAET